MSTTFSLLRFLNSFFLTTLTSYHFATISSSILPDHREKRRQYRKSYTNAPCAARLRKLHVADTLCFCSFLKTAEREIAFSSLPHGSSIVHIVIHGCASGFFTASFFKITPAFVSEEVNYDSCPDSTSGNHSTSFRPSNRFNYSLDPISS